MAKGKMYQVPDPAAKGKPKQPQAPGKQLIASNKRARHDYVIEDVYEAGIVLSGTEVKALRAGRASLVDGFVLIDRGEAWLEGVHISEYTQGTWNNHAPRRRRKLLLHKSEIVRLGYDVQAKGYAIVPLSLYFLAGRVKVELALGRGKREYDKRQALREKQDNRESMRAMRQRELL